jgi:hypothetical protein
MLLVVAWFLIPLFIGPRSQPVAATSGYLHVLRRAIELYHTDYGFYPSAQEHRRRTNEGSHVLYEVFISHSETSDLVKTMRKRGNILETSDGPILSDSWGNPIVYYDCKSYLVPSRYTVNGEVVVIRPLVDTEGIFLDPETFQLFSLGPDAQLVDGRPPKPILPPALWGR